MSDHLRNAGEEAAQLHSLSIDRALRQDQILRDSHYSLLLFGYAYSGISTILTQVRLAFLGLFSEEERLAARQDVWRHVLRCGQDVVRAMQDANATYALKPNEDLAKFVGTYEAESRGQPDEELGRAIVSLWNDPARQRLGEQNRAWEMDFTAYFCQEAARLLDPDDVPTQVDILRTPAKHIGTVDEVSVQHDSNTFRFLNLSRVHNNPKKWIHMFDDVDALLYCFDIGSYDVVYEAQEDMITDNLLQLESISKNHHLRDKKVIVFLNKSDVFTRKLSSRPLSRYLKDYEGGADSDAAIEHIKKLIYKRIENAETRVSVQVTDATGDVEAMRPIFEEVMKLVSRDSVLDDYVVVSPEIIC